MKQMDKSEEANLEDLQILNSMQSGVDWLSAFVSAPPASGLAIPELSHSRVSCSTASLASRNLLE